MNARCLGRSEHKPEQGCHHEQSACNQDRLAPGASGPYEHRAWLRRLYPRLGGRRPASIADERIGSDLGAALAASHLGGILGMVIARLKSRSSCSDSSLVCHRDPRSRPVAPSAGSVSIYVAYPFNRRRLRVSITNTSPIASHPGSTCANTLVQLELRLKR